MTLEKSHVLGPVISCFSLTDEIVNDINTEMDLNKSTDKDTPYGNIGIKPTINPALLKVHEQFFMECITSHMALMTYEKEVPIITKAWFVSMNEPWHYNEPHWHNDCNFTSVGYTQLPDNYDEILERDKTAGTLIFDVGFPIPPYSITPVIGNYYIFPWYLKHSVPPMGPLVGERRSFGISYNITEADDNGT